MDIAIAAPIFAKVDALSATFVTDVSSRAITTILPVVTAGLTLSFIMYGTMILLGTVQAPVLEFIKKCLFVGVIVSIAAVSGMYQADIAGIITTAPDDLARSLLSDPTTTGTAASFIDTALMKGAGVASDAFDKAGWWGDGLLYAVLGGAVGIVTVLLAIIGMAILMLAKVALAVLAGLGPLFILSLLFKSTQQFFVLWITQIANYTTLIVLFAAIFGFFVSLFSSYVGKIQFDGVQNVVGSVIGAATIAGSAILVLRQLPRIAAGLAGGVSLGLSREVRSLRGAVPRLRGRGR